MMSVHAQAIPSIASGISRLRNAHSASLREKLDRMSREEERGNASQKLKDGTDEVKRRLWLLCQTRIRPEPTKGHRIRRKAEKHTIDQSPSQVVLADGEDAAFPLSIDDFTNGTFIAAGDYDLVASCDAYTALPKPHLGPDPSGVVGLPQASEADWSEELEPLSDGWTDSSEGDYFYADGQGNVYPVKKQDDLADWSPASQLIGSEGLDDEEEGEEEDEIPWDEGVNEAYIMYHEVQDWFPEPDDDIHAVDGAGQFALFPTLDDEPFDDWGD
jgi:hypothetical protein